MAIIVSSGVVTNNPQLTPGMAVSATQKRNLPQGTKTGRDDAAGGPSGHVVVGGALSLTVYVQPSGAGGDYDIEACMVPAFTAEGVFDPATSTWAVIDTISASNAAPGSRDLPERAYAFRVNTAVAQTYDVYFWV